MAVESPFNTSATTGRDNIAQIVQIMLMKNSVLAPNFFNVSSYAEAGDKSISFPYATNNFSVQKIVGNEKGDDQEIVFGLDKLELDEEAHIQWLIKGFDQMKARVPVLRTAIENATQTHASGLDADVYAALAAGITNAAITGGVDQDAIVDCITSLNNEYVPQEGRFWVFSTAGYGKLTKIAGFVDASKSNMEIVRTGQVGILYGYPVFMSNAITATVYDGGLFHPQALAYGFASMPKVEDESAIAYGTGSRRFVMDQNYGQKILNGGKLGVFIAVA